MVMVLAGQSNATGFESYAVDPDTGINYLAAPYANGADANDLITWESWDVLQGDGANPVPLDTTQSIESGQSVVNVFGPEIGIGRQLWNDQARPVTFIKTAYAGTDLGFDWSPHGSGTAPNGLYPAMVARVKSVMSADAANGQFDVLGGFYWYQGEADASRVKDAKNYQANLKAFIKAVRSDLPIAPTAPFVIAKEDCTAYFAFEYNAGEVNSATLASLQTGNSEVRAADDWAAAHLPSVVEVDSLNLPRSAPFYIHLTNVSELTIGQEMATVSEPLLP
jgi:hypothetical protein